MSAGWLPEGRAGGGDFQSLFATRFGFGLARVVARLELSTRSELTLALRWLGILYGRIDASFAATGGVQRGQDVLKAIAAGASVVQVASVLYRNGIQALGDLREDVEKWMAVNNQPSIESLRGSLSQLRCSDPAAFARTNYTRAISCFAEAST